MHHAIFTTQKNILVGGKGHGFESWCRILDGKDIFHIDLL